MLSIKVAFKKKTEGYKYTESAAKLLAEIDKKLARFLKEKGYGSGEIENFLNRHNPMLRNMSEDKSIQYLSEVIGESFPASQDDLPEVGLNRRIYEECLQERKDELISTYLAAELKNLLELHKQGYNIAAIAKSFDDNSLMSRHFKDIQLVKDEYKNLVFSRLSKEIMISELDEIKYAREILKNREEAIVKKYHQSSDKALLSQAEEASIFCSTLVVDKISVKTLMDIFREDSQFASDEAYTAFFEEKLKTIRQLYQSIDDAIMPTRQSSPQAVYRFFAKQYMQDNKVTLLCGRDDKAICQRLLDMKYPKPLLTEALAASPVAAEPTRRSQKYIQAIIDSFMAQDERKKITLEESQKFYKAVREKIDTDLKKKGITAGFEHNKDYYACISAKLMLKNGHPRQQIETALRDQEYKQDEANVTGIIFGASMSIKYEQAMLAYNIPDELQHGNFLTKKFHELEEAGFSARDVYYTYIRERINLNPSIRENLINESIDRDVIEFFLNSFDDVSPNVLIDMLQEVSPRAFMSGIGSDYSKELVYDVYARVQAYKNKDKEFTELLMEYNLQHGLAAEGLTVDNQLMAEYQDGYIAANMLRRNFPFFDVRNVILNNNDDMPIDKAQAYVDRILEKSEKVISRENAIIEHAVEKANKGIDDKHDINSIYKSMMAKMYAQKGFLQSTMDIRAAARCLASDYDADAVRAALSENSPIAAEAGRDENYIDYCMAIANDKLRKEREKLEHFRFIPREKEYDDIEQEYGELHDDLEKAVDLPWNLSMDAVVAAALIDRGYAVIDTENVIDRASAKNKITRDNRYAKNAIKLARQKISKVVDRSSLNNEQVLQLERTLKIDTSGTKEDKKKNKA